ncbi:hypothetical protein ON010_g4374 [Phytophthora cinnamomi]|nr:hypothetical protein ON010_g4374 [Phytophthora cinnamomi]
MCILGCMTLLLMATCSANLAGSEVIACTTDQAGSGGSKPSEATEIPTYPGQPGLIPAITQHSSSSGSSGSNLRTVNVGMGCPEFQIAFDSATPGNTLPFKSFTLTKGTGYAYVELHFSKFWVPRETSVVLRAVEGYDVADTKLNISTDYPSGRAYSDVVAPLVLSKEFRIEFYRNEGSRNTTDVDITTDDFNVTDSQSKCFGFVVDSYYYVLVDDNNPLVATVESVCAADNTNEAICYYDDSSTRAAYLAARSVARLFITKGATYGYLRLKTRAGIVGEQLYIPQHPLGNRKRIALVDDYTSNVALLSLSATSCGTTGYSYSGDTHSGSSGSPVLSYSDHGVVALHHCGDMRGNTGIPAKSIVADLKASGIDVAAFDGVDDESSPSTNFERFPAYTPPVPAVVLPLTTRLKQDGAISLAAGFVSIDKVEFTLSKDTDIVFNVFSVEMADNDTFVDLNGDCKATYLDSMIYLFPAGDSIPVFCADDGNVDGTLKDGSVSFRDPYKRTFLKKGSYILAIAPTGSSEEDALAGKTKADYSPELYTCRARGSYGSYRLENSSTIGDNPFTFTRLPRAVMINPKSCKKPTGLICSS